MLITKDLRNAAMGERVHRLVRNVIINRLRNRASLIVSINRLNHATATAHVVNPDNTREKRPCPLT